MFILKKKNSMNQVWDKLFDLKTGIRVKLTKDTVFNSDNQRESFTLPKGTKGTVYHYTPRYPFITVTFIDKNGKEHLCYLDVNRVEKIWE